MDDISSKPGRIVEFVGVQGVGKSELCSRIIPENALSRKRVNSIYHRVAKKWWYQIFFPIFLCLGLRTLIGKSRFRQFGKIVAACATIKAAREDGRVVVLDEGVVRMICYCEQRGYINPQTANSLLDTIGDIGLLPDVVVFLDAPTEVVAERLASRNMPERYLDSRPVAELRPLIEAMRASCARLTARVGEACYSKVVILDGTRPVDELVRLLESEQLFESAEDH